MAGFFHHWDLLFFNLFVSGLCAGPDTARERRGGGPGHCPGAGPCCGRRVCEQGRAVGRHRPVGHVVTLQVRWHLRMKNAFHLEGSGHGKVETAVCAGI